MTSSVNDLSLASSESRNIVLLMQCNSTRAKVRQIAMRVVVFVWTLLALSASTNSSCELSTVGTICSVASTRSDTPVDHHHAASGCCLVAGECVCVLFLGAEPRDLEPPRRFVSGHSKTIIETAVVQPRFRSFVARGPPSLS